MTPTSRPEEVDTYGARRRALFYTYEDDPTAPPTLVVDGLTTDHGLLMLYETAVTMHTDAWMLKRAGMLPDWWRLVQMVRAENLRTGKAVRTTYPMGEAVVRLRGLTAAQIEHTVQGWRVIRTRGEHEGRITRVTERRTVDTVREGQPDLLIRHTEAFTEERSEATVTLPDGVDVSRIAVTVVGEYTLLPADRAA